MKGLILLVLFLVAIGWVLFRRYERQRIRPGTPETAKPPISRASRMAEVERLAKSGEKIEAIKLYREIHGVGLTEAKEAVDQLVEPRAE